MKKIVFLIALMSFALFTFVALAPAAGDAGSELRPSQKLMQARKAWVASMGENLGAKKFESILPRMPTRWPPRPGRPAKTIPTPPEGS